MDFGWCYLKMTQISTFCRTFLPNLKVCEGILLLKKTCKFKRKNYNNFIKDNNNVFSLRLK